MKTTRFTWLISVLIGLGLSSAANAGKTYTLKGDAPTGTLLQSIDARSQLPFDKRYFELTDEQRTMYRARFDSISASQVPPFPRNGLREVYRPLIDANKKGARGVLTVNVKVNKSGQVEDLTVINSPNSQLADASERILRNMQFDPAYCAGEPCAMNFPVEINYQ